jgi:hypothetical protein
MSDTTILDGLMATLKRNPLTPERMNYLDRQFVETDERPFYARRETEVGTTSVNRRFGEIVDLFHQDIRGVRKERPRSGSCHRVRVVERHIDGQVWTRQEACQGTVHAVETVINGAVRVDGKCLSCGWEVHRAGLLHEKG